MTQKYISIVPHPHGEHPIRPNRARTPGSILGVIVLTVVLASSTALAQVDTSATSFGPPTLLAPSNTVLPPIGINPYDPNLQSDLLDAFGQPQPIPAGLMQAGPPWQLSGMLTVSEQWTNNADVGSIGNSRNHGDFITLIQPQIGLNEDSDRLRVSLSYAPIGEIYADHGNYSQYQQQFFGDSQATLLNDLLYVDLRGNISDQSVFGPSYANAFTLGPEARETTTSVSVTPYVARTFGTFGTFQAGAGYIYTDTDAPSFAAIPTSSGPSLPGGTGSSWLATKRLFASFTTGEDYDRIQNQVSSDNSFYDGSTASDGGKRLMLTDDVSYAINRFICALGEIGYENLDYPSSGFHYAGGVWSAGARITPDQDSALTVEWRYLDGQGAPYVFGSWQASPRIRLFGGYSEGATTFDLDQQNTLLSGQTDSAGVNTSSLVAAPLMNSGNYAGGNQTLNRTQRLNANASFVADRDTITITADWERSTVLGTPIGLPESELRDLGINPAYLPLLIKYGIPPYLPQALRTALERIILLADEKGQRSTYLIGGATWHHDLQPDLTSDIYVGYTNTIQNALLESRTSSLQVTAGLSKTFSETLSGRITYAGSFVLGATQHGVDMNDNAVTISIAKRF